MITKKQVEHIAKLSRLGLKEKEIDKARKELAEILDYFEKLKKIDVSKTRPTFHPGQRFLKDKSKIMRKDISSSGSFSDKLISLAPETKERHIKVKTVF